ncbi:TrkH family potassium uptake protein [Pseudoalteromonas arctica]|uniref:Ktr system potassium transporter B n=1 Tax=Pseudoalteromonas arctica TaxID=394751 RepID=A0A7Y0DU46_9GAMM|nr:TrkH family potassium uptake protein [Pseudoalteromonas arctica]NMM41653.1 Ktr system potassium transporter B [Pseudoalteromonas arctica]
MVLWHPLKTAIERSPSGNKKINAAPPLILCCSFLILIALGALALKLPFATNEPISWIQSAFTATSAVTVTGLVVVDTGSAFTPFGQGVIALLIQLGGLGLMTFAVVTLLALGNKVGFIQKTVTKAAFNQTDTSTLLSTAKSVLLFAIIVESLGVVILTLYWLPELGLQTGFFQALFYTISAFNNAGFALSPDSLMQYVDDPVINFTITGLFIIGGLGFTVLMDVYKAKRWAALSTYSKLMLLSTAIINIVALVLIYVIEYDNPKTLQPLSEAGKWLAAWFQAVTPRTAGFNTIAIEELRNASSALIMMLMFIGGGSLSTASGIKVVTFVVLILATYSYLRRDKGVTVLRREIDKEAVYKALALTLVSAGITWLAIFTLLIVEDAPFLDVAFEAVSALGTVGLSRGLTASLSPLGEFIIMFLMFMGRIGPLTIAYFLASPRCRKLRYPSAPLSIG